MLYKHEEVEKLRPNRLQYSLREGAYMLDTSEDTLKTWATLFGVEIYKINGTGKNYISHNDLVEIQKKGQRLKEGLYGS